MKEHKLIASLFIFTAGLIVGVQLLNTSPEQQFVSNVMSDKYGAAAVLNSNTLSPISNKNAVTTKSAVVKNPIVFSSDQFYGLTFGSTGYNVNLLQHFLESQGYFPEDVEFTEYFGPITLNALKDFQQENNLSSTGVVDSQTSALLLPIGEEDEDISVNQIPDDGIGPYEHSNPSSAHYVGTRNHTLSSDSNWPYHSPDGVGRRFLELEDGTVICHRYPSDYYDCSL